MSYPGRPYPRIGRYGRKGLGGESDDVIVGVTAEGLKRFIVQIVIKRIMHKPEIRWTEKVGT